MTVKRIRICLVLPALICFAVSGRPILAQAADSSAVASNQKIIFEEKISRPLSENPVFYLILFLIFSSAGYLFLCKPKKDGIDGIEIIDDGD